MTQSTRPNFQLVTHTTDVSRIVCALCPRLEFLDSDKKLKANKVFK